MGISDIQNEFHSKLNKSVPACTVKVDFSMNNFTSLERFISFLFKNYTVICLLRKQMGNRSKDGYI